MSTSSPSYEYRITDNDLDRIETWMREINDGCTLDSIIRRFVRGRIIYGVDRDGNVLPEIKEYTRGIHVLSWDQLAEWKVGSQVLVARRVNNKVQPKFGTITGTEKNGLDECFVIHIGNENIKYAKLKPGSNEVIKIIRYLREAIRQEQINQEINPNDMNIEKRIDMIILNQGAMIASRMNTVLTADDRFIFSRRYWHLKAWIHPLDDRAIRKLHRQMYTGGNRFMDYPALCTYFGLINNRIGQLSISYHLQMHGTLFEEMGDGWKALKPPPPTWDNAKGNCFVYDPENYQIILKPGEPLNHKTAKRLEDTGFYAEVVEAIEEYY